MIPTQITSVIKVLALLKEKKYYLMTTTETFNSYFANVVETLNIEGFITSDYSYKPELHYISNIIEKFKNHPSVIKIKKTVKIDEHFHFADVDESVIYMIKSAH